MGSGVVALVVARDREAHLDSVLLAAASQTLRPDAILLLDCSADSSLNPVGFDHGRIIRTPGAANLGEAIRSVRDEPEPAAARWWWILHDDSIPEPSCLRALWEAADRGRTIGLVGAKQMSPDGARLLELGIRATRSARRLERVSPGEIDQGQYDSTSDVLAAGTAGALVSPASWDAVGGFDPRLGPFGDGLDFGRRLHLAGFRVVVAPGARVRHSRLSLLAPDSAEPLADEPREGEGGGSADPAPPEGPGGAGAARERPAPEDASFAARRFAQIYNWAKAAPAPALPLLMAWLAIWSPARALARLMSGAPHLARPELSAWASAIAATPALLSARRVQARSSRVPAKALKGLEASGRELRERRRELAAPEAAGADAIDPLVLESVKAHRSKSRRSLLLVLAVTLLLAAGRWWGMDGALTGGAWRALPASGAELWEAAWSTWIPGGDGRVGPADPLLIPLALLGAPLSVLGLSPTALARLLLFTAGPLAAMSAWRFASRLSASPGLRGASALAWAVLPALSASQTQGRLAPALFHVLLPLAASAWISIAARTRPLRVEGAEGLVDAPAREHSGALARFSLLGAGLVACTPWAILPLVGALALLVRRGTSARGALAALAPALLLIAPTLITACRTSAWRALLSPSGPDAASFAPPGWQAILGAPAGITRPEILPLALAPGGLLLAAALLGLLLSSRSTTRGRALLVLCSALALSGGAALSRLDVGLEDSQVLSAWPAPALSLGALGLIGIILAAAPASPAWNSTLMRRIGSLSALASLLLIAGGAAPILERTLETAAGGTDAQGPATTGITETPGLIPAVSAQAQASGRAGRVLLLDSDAALNSLDVRLWRGEGPSILDSTPTSRAQDLRAALEGEDADPARAELAELALTLVVYPDEATVRRLADHGIDTILIRPDSAGLEGMSDALDRAPGLERVGDTAAGSLWRLRLDALHAARARILEKEAWTNLDSRLVRASTTLTEETRGMIVLAERYDPGWTATIDGRPLEGAPRGWAQSFTLDGGTGELLISHNTRWAAPWRVLSLSALALAALSAIPWRRRA